MPNPNTSIAIPRPDLGGSMLEFDLEMDRRGFIGLRVAPVIEADKPSGQYGVIPLEEVLLNGNTERAPDGSYPRDDFEWNKDTFQTQEHGQEARVDDHNAAVYSEFWDWERLAGERARDRVVRGMEIAIADTIFNSTTWTGGDLTTGISNEWDSNHTSDAVPIDDVKSAKDKVFENTGLDANALIINRDVFENLRALDQIKDIIASSGAGDPTRARDITVQQLAQVFDLDFIIVAGGAQNTADQGQSASISRVWSSEYAMVAKIATTNNIEEPCIARTIHYGGDGSMIGAAMESYRSEERRSDIVRARNERQIKVIYKECGHLLSNATTI